MQLEDQEVRLASGDAGRAAKEFAGPGVTLSFLLAGLSCSFSALCYAELASAIPVSGSAYSYAYVTLGEAAAWFIGWNLTLEVMPMPRGQPQPGESKRIAIVEDNSLPRPCPAAPLHALSAHGRLAHAYTPHAYAPAACVYARRT